MQRRPYACAVRVQPVSGRKAVEYALFDWFLDCYSGCDLAFVEGHQEEHGRDWRKHGGGARASLYHYQPDGHRFARAEFEGQAVCHLIHSWNWYICPYWHNISHRDCEQFQGDSRGREAHAAGCALDS